MAHDEPPDPNPAKAGKPARLPVAQRRDRLAELVLRRSPLSPDEQALLREVFPVILELHEAKVLAQITRRGVNPARAEELVTDVFVLLYKQIVAEGFPDVIPAKLRVLTRGKILNHVRDEHRCPFSIGLPSSGREPPPTGPGADSAAGIRDLAARLLQGLSPDHADIVELVLLEGLTLKEAAAELDLPVGTAKSRMAAAKASLLALAHEILPPSQWPAQWTKTTAGPTSTAPSPSACDLSSP